MFLLPLNVNVLKNHKKHKHGLLPPIEKFLTVTNKKLLTKRATISVTSGREGKTGFRTKMQKLHHVFISFSIKKNICRSLGSKRIG